MHTYSSEGIPGMCKSKLAGNRQLLLNPRPNDNTQVLFVSPDKTFSSMRQVLRLRSRALFVPVDVVLLVSDFSSASKALNLTRSRFTEDRFSGSQGFGSKGLARGEGTYVYI